MGLIQMNPASFRRRNTESIFICGQEWMLRNVDIDLPGSKVYSNDEANRALYGGLYDFSMLADINAAYPGWRVPTKADFEQVLECLGFEIPLSEWGIIGTNEGGKLKSTRTDPDAHPRWNSPNTAATNETGFSALPGGVFITDTFYSLGQAGTFWLNTSAPSPPDHGYDFELKSFDGKIHLSVMNKAIFASVRLVRDT